MEDCIAKTRLAVSAGASIGAQGETRSTLTVKTSRSVCALAAHTRVSLALVDVHTFSTLCLVTWITKALETTLRVDALAMVTHARLPALVDVSAKGSVW